MLSSQEAICVEVLGSGLAAVGDLTVLLEGPTETAVRDERRVEVSGDRAAPSRFAPVAGGWPEGAYRLTLSAGEHELAKWDLEIRAGVTAADTAGE